MNASQIESMSAPGAALGGTGDRLGQVEEHLLVLRAQLRDHAAFQALLQLYERRILYYIHRLVDDPEAALDVAQDVWLTVYQKIHSLRSPEAFRVWLFRVAYHQAATAARRDLRRVEVQEELAEAELATECWDERTQFDDARLVHRTLAGISVAHREVLALRFLEDLSLNEIAEVTGCNLATAKTRLHYAKKAFRKAFQTRQQPKGTP